MDANMKRKGLFFWMFWACLLFLHTYCQIPESQEGASGFNLSDPQRKNDTILEIGDTLFTNSDFEKYIRATLGDDQDALTVLSLGRLFDNFVEEKLLLQAARKVNMILTEGEKDEYL